MSTLATDSESRGEISCSSHRTTARGVRGLAVGGDQSIVTVFSRPESPFLLEFQDLSFPEEDYSALLINTIKGLCGMVGVLRGAER